MISFVSNSKVYNFLKMHLALILLIGTIGTISTVASSNDFLQNNANFATHFYSTLTNKEAGKSVTFSPFSLQTCFSMLYMGTKGQTASELERGFHLGSSDRQEISNNFKNLLQKYKNSQQIKVANKIYIDNKAELVPQFKEVVTQSFYSEIESNDLTKGEETATIINNWIQNKTNGKIYKLIEADDCDESTRLILLNAIYFKGNWKYPFDKELTKKQPFHVSSTESVDVDMMNIKKYFNYRSIPNHKLSVVELPYADCDLTMLLLIPDEIEGLSAIESKLQQENFLSSLTDEFSEFYIQLLLPKFKVTTEIDLKEILSTMGVEKVFNDDGELDDLAALENNKLKISKAVHKAVVEINEEGTEAAAVTGLNARIVSGYGFPEVIVDRPFLFFIRDNEGHNLFMGRFSGNK